MLIADLMEGGQPTPQDLTAAINATLEKFISSGRVKNAYEIGGGWCDVFAAEVRRALGNPRETSAFYLENTTGLWGEEFSIDQKHAPHISQDTLDRIGEATHEWIVLNNRHYDAETPEGVDHWYDLPFFRRWIDAETKLSENVHGANAIMVVVHPGSLCGSADMNLGPGDAEMYRRLVADEISNFFGPIAIVRGDFEEELKLHKYSYLGAAIEECEIAADDTFEVYGEASREGLTQAAQAIVRHYGCNAEDLGLAGGKIIVTGAWADAQDGCVTFVAKTLKQLAPKSRVVVSKNAPSCD